MIDRSTPPDVPEKTEGALPCPLCGHAEPNVVAGVGEVWVVCNQVGCRQTSPAQSNLHDALESWNAVARLRERVATAEREAVAMKRRGILEGLRRARKLMDDAPNGAEWRKIHHDLIDLVLIQEADNRDAAMDDIATRRAALRETAAKEGKDG